MSIASQTGCLDGFDEHRPDRSVERKVDQEDDF